MIVGAIVLGAAVATQVVGEQFSLSPFAGASLFHLFDGRAILAKGIPRPFAVHRRGVKW